MSSVLVTKRVYKEAVEFLQQHAEVDYVSTDDGLSPPELILRARGKQAIICHLTDMFSADVLSQLEGVRLRCLPRSARLTRQNDTSGRRCPL
jgi:hypothetical protein